MTPHQTRALDMLAPAVGAPTVAPSREHGRLRDEEAQLARLELSLARAEGAGETGLVAKLTVLRHAQQGRVMEARRLVRDPSSFSEFLDGMKERIAAMGLGGAR